MVSRRAEAWFLDLDRDGTGAPAKLRRDTFELPPLGADDVFAEPIYGCWEGNMGHALERRPIDLCQFRDEPRVILGNAGVLRVVEVGANVANVEPGQTCVLVGNTMIDRFGYPQRLFGYDAAGTMGCLATKIRLLGRELVPVPANTRHRLEQWAAFSVRYITAWSNWRLAHGTFRLEIGHDELPASDVQVWGWGGGTALAELDLARREGCRAVMLSSADKHDVIVRCGITPVDRSAFSGLAFDEKRYATEASYRRSYNQAEAAFLAEVKRRTGGAMVQIFVDHIGSAVFRASLKALSRQGIITTAGWKTGMALTLLRATECIDRHQHIHTHYARHSEALAAIAYAEREGWMPPIDGRIFGFDDIPEMAERYRRSELGLFPIYAVNPP